MIEQEIVALLGRRDEPTDAIEEYCNYLGAALHAHSVELRLARVPWLEHGWPAALKELRQQAAAWRGQWVLVQYTALGWSARGFPLRFLHVLNILRKAGARVGIVYHDVQPYSGARLIDKLRRSVQLHAMRRSLRRANLAVFTVPPEKLSWMSGPPAKVVFIPDGANLPIPSEGVSERPKEPGRTPRVAVFGITGGDAGREETHRIAAAVRFAAQRIGNVQLVVLGRNSESGETPLCEALRDVPVEMRVLGLLPSEEVVRVLSASDVLLFVRGQISSRRSSAIAGIACGLPVIAYPGAETAPPITDAGVLLVSPENRAELGEALLRVLTDHEYRASLAERSCRAQQQYFSWQAIAAQFAKLLREQG